MKSRQTNHSFDRGARVRYLGATGYSGKYEDLPDPDEFDETAEYKPWELNMYADAWLKRDFKVRHNFQDPVVLLESHEHERRKREIYVYSGVPGEEFLEALTSPDEQRMYWRTHPQGRKVNDDFQRKNNRASYYR